MINDGEKDLPSGRMWKRLGRCFVDGNPANFLKMDQIML